MVELIRLEEGRLPGADVLARVAEAARSGQVVAFPTDTVYGLGTSAQSREGVARIYRIKGRIPDKPLPLLAADAAEAGRWVEGTPQAQALARRFWPGALTLVLKANAAGRDLACCQGSTLAVRVPAHPVALALLQAAGGGLASTSANRAGEPPIADAEELSRAFGSELAFILAGSPSEGRESSVVDASAMPVRILREGALAAADIRSAAPEKLLFVCAGNTCRSVMAEFLFNRLAAERAWPAQARSAGVAADPAFPIPTGVRAALAGEGIPAVEHQAQPVTAALLEWADLVLVMERAHQDNLLRRFPQFSAKVRTLAGRAGRPGGEDIADPIGRPETVYAACCREIKTSLEAILNDYAPHPENARP